MLDKFVYFCHLHFNKHFQDYVLRTVPELAQLKRFVNDLVFFSVTEHIQLSEQLFGTVRYCTWSLLSTIVLQLYVIIQTHHHQSFHFIYYKFFTFSIQTMFNLIPSEANDPQGLMPRLAPNKQNQQSWIILFCKPLSGKQLK